MNIDKRYISRCIELAKNGLGLTYPNPLVGSLLVKNNNIISEAWHQAQGQPHAEALVINKVRDEVDFEDVTLYVNLEPCVHYGKTPPCVDAIIKSGIKKVVLGSPDPNAIVHHKGIYTLKKAGIDVTQNVLLNECVHLNKRFFTYHNKKRPYIILKWAESKDKFMDVKKEDRISKNRYSHPISNSFSQVFSHKLRASEQAILVGTNTAIQDNPRLTPRHYFGKKPIRIILDRRLRIPKESHIFDQSTPTIIYTEKQNEKSIHNICYQPLIFDELYIKNILKSLYQKNICSLIVEGGRFVLQSFIDNAIWDEIYRIVSPKNLDKGLKAPNLDISHFSTEPLGTDLLYRYRR